MFGPDISIQDFKQAKITVVCEDCNRLLKTNVFTCPNCGHGVYCSEEEWFSHRPYHQQVCEYRKRFFSLNNTENMEYRNFNRKLVAESEARRRDDLKPIRFAFCRSGIRVYGLLPMVYSSFDLQIYERCTRTFPRLTVQRGYWICAYDMLFAGKVEGSFTLDGINDMLCLANDPRIGLRTVPYRNILSCVDHIPGGRVF